ncbi:helix-turn-helix domain-containing protein [Streptomyces botrytidirepellens]|uniref:helix-turn-helix domain-containing protein n=1 Tax=Streptomyces botrytidirepellens TaxID=2486417 RepID=UPI00161A7395|nr:helix-turn-helix domain-containing protein [Streptomyces botrytidirepellens]
MAEQHPSAPARALSLVRRSAGGVTHVRERHPNRYTIVGNHLTQHRELSLTAIGLAAHIQSLPDGAPVDIRTLAERFPEGRERIAAALRELEAYGYLERVRERTSDGRVVTRTYAYNHPEATRTRRARESQPVQPVRESQPVQPVREPQPAPPPTRHTPEPEPEPGPAPAPVAATAPTPAAAAILATLRRDDDRLLLSERDVRRLAPAVAAWLERGAAPDAVRRTLSANLPPDLRHPAAFLAHRLTALLPSPLPAAPAPSPRSVVVPLRNCNGCDRAFRSPTPGARCRDCRHAAAPAAA